MDDKQYTRSTKLALKYQDGEDKAGEKLLEDYNNTVRLFVKTLYYGNYYKGNKLVESFTKLLVSKGTNERDKAIKNILDVISTKYQTYYSITDLEQDVKEAILRTALKYKPDKINKPFEYFFKIYFCYMLKSNTIDRLDAPISVAKDENSMDYIKSKRSYNKSDRTTDFIDSSEYFVEGETTSGLFEDISKKERELLSEYYLEDNTLKEIAAKDKYDVTLNALSMRLKKIRNKINNKKEELGIELEDIQFQ